MAPSLYETLVDYIEKGAKRHYGLGEEKPLVFEARSAMSSNAYPAPFPLDPSNRVVKGYAI